MKVERKEGSVERRVLTGMIVDKSILAAVAAKWDGKRFESRWANIVGGWCVEYLNRYGRAPGKAIEALYESWASETKDKESAEMIDTLLTSLSSEYERQKKRINPDLVIDLASKQFNKNAFLKLSEQLQGDVDMNDLEKAYKRVTSFHKVEMGQTQGVDILRDREAMRRVFETKREPLVVYRGALGNFFKNYLARDSFIAFEGREKSGKSTYLMDVGWRAMLQGHRVAFFEVGDMSQDQILERFYVRAAKRPMEAGEYKIPSEITAVDADKEGNSKIDISFKTKRWEKDLTFEEAEKACQKIIGDLETEDTLLKLSCHPNSSVSVKGIESVLEDWERQEWTPDIIVIDYADILAPLYGQTESRETINATWKALRAMSQSRHCLVLTATQADAGSYNTETLTMSNFSEDKRKHAHVTGMIGINCTEEEQDNGISRLNWIVLREGAARTKKCCCCIGSMELKNPSMFSTF